PPIHVRVLVLEEDQLRDLQDPACFPQLGLPDSSQPRSSLLRIESLVQDLAAFAAGGGDQGRAHTLRCILGQRSPHANGFVVGVGFHGQQAALGHRAFRVLISWVSCGTIFCTSPTTPRSAILKMGASGSLLMAMMVLAPFMPTVCCMAPAMPPAM